jgi:hypothetical protein
VHAAIAAMDPNHLDGKWMLAINEVLFRVVLVAFARAAAEHDRGSQ